MITKSIAINSTAKWRRVKRLNVTSNMNKDNIRFGVKIQPLSNEQRIAHDNDVITILQ